MSFKQFCPKCGKETTVFVEKICLDCFTKGKTLFSIDKPKVSACKYCGYLLLKGKWVAFSEKTLSEEIATRVKLSYNLEKTKVFVELQQISDYEYEAAVKVQGFLESSLVTGEKIIKIELKETTCDACMKLSSDYREAVIQLRADTLEEAGEMFETTKSFIRREKANNQLSDFSKIVEIKRGFDLWVGSKRAASKVARQIAKIYNAKLKTSSKLIGEDKSGKQVFRETFLIRK